MANKKIELQFDMSSDMDKRVYYALKNLPDFYNEPDLSKAVVRFVNDLVASVGECEEREARCLQILESLLGKQGLGRVNWQ